MLQRPARFALVSFAVVAALSCRAKKGAYSMDASDTAPPKATGAAPGLVFSLTNATPERERIPVAKAADATALSAGDTKKVLSRLPALVEEVDDQKDFALRERSAPPPLTGATVLGAFPPKPRKPGPVTAPKGALEVVRFAPEGEVPLAPELSLTFSHPMVAVTSVDVLAKGEVPVTLTPEPKGKWRWIGTKTLKFEPDGRFPMATSYDVTVPAGTKSAVGTKSAKARRWTFSTPAPSPELVHPQGVPTRRQPLVFVSFDQRIDPLAVSKTIVLSHRAKETSVRLASPEEIAADEAVAPLVAAAQPGRYAVVVPNAALPADADITITIGPGVPSSEGPRKSRSAATFKFRTFGPMKVSEHRCGYEHNCPPGTPFEIVFTNPIDPEKFDRAMVTADPAITDMRVEVHGDRMYVSGPTRGRTKYGIRVRGDLADRFGQRLGKDVDLTFRTTSAPESLWSAAAGLVVLDPAVGPVFNVMSTNHEQLRVRAWKVTPDDWRAYLGVLENAGRDPRAFSAPGKLAFDDKMRPAGKADEIVETGIDLSRALSKGLGHVIIAIEPTKAPKEPWQTQRVVAWVQVTRLGLSAHLDDDTMWVWTNALADGAAKAGVKVELRPTATAGKSGADGLAKLPLTSKSAQIVVARDGDDVAFLPESIGWWNPDGSWKTYDRGAALRWFVFDDRRMYRPGEEVALKGWLRDIDNRKGGDVGGVPKGLKSVAWELRDAVGNKVSDGTLSLNAFGAFDTRIALPKTMNTGGAQLTFTAKGRKSEDNQWWHGFEVQEFRRPEYEVSARLSEGPHLVGSHAVATVAAKYYAGGPLPGAEVTWQVTASPGHYQPPGHDGYQFGKIEPWWCFWRHWGPYQPDPADEPRTQGFTATTDGAGEHALRVDFVSVSPARAMGVSTQATVMDRNRQAWTSSAATVVHPADVYVGLKTDRAFVQAGDSLEIDAIAVDIDGKPRVGVPIHIRIARLQWEQSQGKMIEKELDPATCDRKSEGGPVRCSFAVAKGGSWRVVATVTDAKSRINRTEFETWVAGGELPAPRDVSQEQVLLIADKTDYAAGETAKIAVSAPWPGAHGLVTLRRSGIIEARRIDLSGTSTTIEVPISDALVPNVTVQVDLVGSAPRRDDHGKIAAKLPKRVAFASGTVDLSIPPRQRTLSIDVAPAVTKLEPGGTTTVALDVRDATGAPASGVEVALVVVDEAVLALSGYRIEDPLAAFYGPRDPGGRDHHVRSQVALARSQDLGLGDVSVTTATDGGRALPMAAKPASREAAQDDDEQANQRGPAKQARGDSDRSSGHAPIDLRTNFDALALFSPSVRTDSRGHAEVPLKLPDNLTRYRITAVAVAGERSFGRAEAQITARLPLMVRPSAPRFLNFGDAMELPVLVQNQTDTEMTVDVAVRAANAELTRGAGRRVSVPANDRVELRFTAKAVNAGTARFQVAAASGRWADAAAFELPVWTPATTEAFATYGELDKGALQQPVQPPPGVFPQFGGLEITTSSTAVSALTDAVLYLVSYPFECSEQVASRVLAIAALRDVLDAFDAEGLPPRKQLQATVDRDLAKLAKLQTDDGGFSFWGRAWPSWPYLSIHVLHALERARLKGFDVPKAMLDRAREHVRAIERHIPPEYPIECKWAIRAYALYVARLAGKADRAKAVALIDEAGIDRLSLESLGWLLPSIHEGGKHTALVEKIQRRFANAVSETAADAHFTTAYTDGAHLLLASDRRADAIILEALIDTDPRTDLIPKLVRGLLDHRTAGRWESTQENAFVLVALDRYFGAFEKATPDFVAKAWLGNNYAGDHAFRGRTTERHHIEVPMAWMHDKAKGTTDLVLTKNGPGRMYYRIGMRYAPRDLKLPPYDAGFVVQRSYEAVDDPGDVRRDADGTWRIKAGARVRVRLGMVAESRRYHVALVDPLPAGLEPVNPALATTGELPPDPKGEATGRDRWWWWWRPWYEHTNMRDERVEAFTSLLWEGVYDFDYIARATTPGTFVAPSPKAEEMYHPETFGRGASDRVIVE